MEHSQEARNFALHLACLYIFKTLNSAIMIMKTEYKIKEICYDIFFFSDRCEMWAS